MASLTSLNNPNEPYMSSGVKSYKQHVINDLSLRKPKRKAYDPYSNDEAASDY